MSSQGQGRPNEPASTLTSDLSPTPIDLLSATAATGAAALLVVLLHVITGRTTFLLPFFVAFVVIALRGRLIASLLTVTLATTLIAACWMGSSALLLHVAIDPATLALFAGAGFATVIGVNRTAQSLQARQVLEKRLRVALEGTAIMVWECDGTGRYTWMQGPTTGSGTQAHIGKRIEDVMPRAQYPEYAAALDRVWTRGVTERVPLTWTQDGQTHHSL